MKDARPDEERLRRVIVRAGVPDGDVDDLLQNVLLRIWQKRALVDASDDPSAYMAEIARNEARAYHRCARGRVEVVTSLDDHDLGDQRPGAEDCLISRQRSDLMWRFINALPPGLRSLFIDRELEGRPLAEIAAEHGIKTKGAEKRLARAWAIVDGAWARWQAGQQRRERGTLGCLLLLFVEIDYVALVRKLRRRVMEIGAPAAVVLLAGGLTGPDPGCAPAMVSCQPALRFSSAVAAVTANVEAPMEDLSQAPSANANVEMSAGGSPAVSATVAGVQRQTSGSTSAGGEEEELIDRAIAAFKIGSSHADLRALSLLQEHQERYRNGRFAAVREALLRELRTTERRDDG